MRYLFRLGWVVALSPAPMVACEQKRAAPGPAVSVSATAPLTRGERVVVEETAAHFYEGRVLEVDGDHVRVEPIGGGASKRIAIAEAYPVGRPCDRCDSGLAICRSDAGVWIPCRVEGNVGSPRRGTTADGKSIELDRGSVLTPSAFTALNLERHFEKTKAQREFSVLAARQPDPRPPRGWRPAPRGRVVAKLGQRWLSATVREIEEKSVHLRFEGGERSIEIETRFVVPEPPHPAAPLRGSFVLLRPVRPAGEWERWRVSSVAGSEFVVVDAAGATRHASRVDVIPLQRGE